jgi:hypothetical protein
MASEKKSIPPKRLTEVARQHGIISISEIARKSGVDRKTLTVIDSGLSTKPNTLKRVADGLRIPLQHLDGSPPGPDTCKTSSMLTLQPIDGRLLKQLLDKVSRDGDIEWLVNLDKVDDDLQSILLNFKERMSAYVALNKGQEEWAHKNRSLEAQLAKIRLSEELQAMLQTVSGHGVRLYGQSWIQWSKSNHGYGSADSNYRVLYYSSAERIIIAVEPRSRTCRIEVDLGEAPPINLDAFPKEIVSVTINDTEVLRRCLWDDDGIPL